ncbi:MAG: hypothetical protein U5K56_06855 [Halioglobus sp.]|nr:hypothetical protein [Halioglobus sp.]
MPQDDLDHIPSIVPGRDDEPERGERRGRRHPERRHGAPPPSGSGGGGSVLARLFLTLALVVAAVACAWAWQLQEELEQTRERMADHVERIGDLEARLSDTDEGMNQSAAAQAARIRELDSEVRKLWDNVWKRSKARLSELEASTAEHAQSIDSMRSSLSSMEGELASASTDIAKLKSVAGDLSRLMASAKSNQAEVERLADAVNRIELELASLGKRVAGNEEWVDSINAFRRQVNTTLSQLQASIQALQTSP